MSAPAIVGNAAERLRFAIDARVRAEVEEACAIAEFAAANEWTGADEYDVTGTRPVRIGPTVSPCTTSSSHWKSPP